MPFPMKIQPIDSNFPANRDLARVESSKPVFKTRLKRLLDRPFTNVLRSSNLDKSLIAAISGEAQNGGAEFEPSLAKMVQNYMEENNEKQTKNGRNRYNCFNGNNDSSDDEFDLLDGFADSFNDAYDYFKVKLNLSSSLSE